MPPILLALLALAAAPEAGTLLDGFEFDGLQAARAAWLPSAESPPATLLAHDGGQALRIDADFAGTEAPRVYHDRVVDLDLTAYGRFTLDVYVGTPGLFSNLTLFFHSGGGWYGVHIPLDHMGWKTLSFSRAAFGSEDAPGGWGSIDRIRLSPWRASARTGYIAVDNLRGYREDVVVVVGTHSARAGSGEAAAAQQYAEQASALLEAAGLYTGTVTDEEVEQGALEGRKLAIFAYSPDLSEAEVAQVRRFVRAGGRILVFYAMGAGLGDLFGINRAEHLRAAAREFHELAPDAGLADGLPERILQDSWNISAVTLDPRVGKAVGWWLDDAGQRSPWPALVESEAGLYMSHVVTEGDGARKQRFLLALVGRYVPEAWAAASARALETTDRLGHLNGADAVTEWTAEHGADQDVARAAAARDRALAARAAGRHAEAIEAAAESRAALTQAYLRSIPPKPGEFRALWNHSGTGAHGDWAVSMKNLHDCGFNAIIPNMLWGGVAHYDSAVLPHSPVVAAQGDQIAACVAAAKPYGIGVHVWKVNWNLGAAPEEFREAMRQEGRLQVHRDGSPIDWLCPSDPRNRDLECAAMVEVAQKYDVDGIHFDYIRYPHQNACFCEGCWRRFQDEVGVTVAEWPEGVSDPAVWPKWQQWRQDNISKLVEQVATQVRAIKPDCRISAAVFRSYPGCRQDVAQDWVMWIERGWLDFVCPMDYTNSDSDFQATVESQLQYVAGRVPVYPGIGVTASSSSLPADRAAGQIQLARDAGAPGFVIFNYGGSVPSDLLPALALGPTRP